MKKIEKEEIIDFKSFYFSLSGKRKVQLRNKILEGCDFSLSTFYYKLTNDNFKKLEIEQINAIFTENMDLFK